jgi:hypothetical protein
MGERARDILSATRRENPKGIGRKNISCGDSQRNTLKNTLHQQCSVSKRPKVEDSVGLSSVEDGISKLQNLSKLEDSSEFDLWARSVAVEQNGHTESITTAAQTSGNHHRRTNQV